MNETTPPSENRGRRLAVPVAVGAAVAAGVGAVAVALASADNTPASAAAASQPTTSSTQTKDHDGPGWWRGGWWGGPWRGGWFGDGDALHGEVVVEKEGGGTETVLFQRGEVTAVSPTAITVRSTDGVTNTFAVNGDTKVNWGDADIGSVAGGEQVVVTGPRSGDTLTAKRVIDLTDLGHK